ncbi:helix-turn-helix transcriptional regulator [Pelotomaculum isophthalicicum JI]|uniref:Helix-turn-helix transcriptional regulator n=1 Tax=Pelotomaculum isophthalicicum JI TaxID=947010 RepID=A0A9X4H959_9FIRM|nr:helix-turn-helix transcriptional regulator [Pelotomaculum isophthalicicum]MDF9409739.1 helix-turn-helix transcriptional regulator [Pelotomaculum isophthalicicum JI]
MAKKQIVCRRLKGLMAENDLTIRELSKKTGISEKTLSLKIRGRRKWWIHELFLVTRQLGFAEIRKVFPEIFKDVLDRVG